MASTPNTLNGVPIRLFKRQSDWAAWLEKNHAASTGLWLKIAKKDAGLQSVSYAEALDVALCYGWIDGQKQRFDETAWLQKFTPRGSRSIWSKINREKAAALIQSGRMQPAGLNEVERARADGRWEAAYDSHRTVSIPEDFQAALEKNAQAKANFAALNSANRYAFLFRIQTARKAETRARRIQQYIGMLEKNEKFYP